MRNWFTSSAVAALMLAITASGCIAQEAISTELAMPLGHEGRWLTDAAGRVVQLHGFNLMRRLPPFEPTPFSEADVVWLADQGFNSMRLGIMYEAVEPQLGVYDDAYIGRMVELNRLLQSHGFHNTVDFHQDVFSRKFNGDGFPEWANPVEPELEAIWKQVADTSAFQEADNKYFWQASLNPVERKAWDYFWTNKQLPNGQGLQDQFIAAWSHVADAFSDDQELLLGYSPINEPLSGNCVLPLCNHIVEQRVPFFQRWLDAVRKVDADRMVFLGSYIWFAGGEGHDHAENTKYIASTLKDGNIGIEQHNYAFGDAQIAQYVDDAALSLETNVPVVVNEFGAGFGPAAKSGKDADLANERFMSWMLWSYYPEGEICCPDSGFLTDDTQPASDANAKPELADALIMPYPQAVAGTPGAYGYDREARTLRFEYSTEAVGAALAADATTVVFVPRRVYPTGYEVAVTGARVLSEPTSPWVVLANDPGAASVTVEITPATGSSVQLPSEYRAKTATKG